MTKKQPDQLVLTRHTDAGAIVPVNRQYPLTKAERRSAIEARKQTQAMGQERMKTILAHQAIGDMNYSSMRTFTTTSEQMYAIKSTGNRPADLQERINLFHKYTSEQFAGHLAESTEAGASNIISIQEQRTDRPISWRERLFGRLRDE